MGWGDGDSQVCVVVVVDGPPNHGNSDVHETVKKRSPEFDNRCILHRIAIGTILVFIKNMFFFLSLDFVDNISQRNVQDMSKQILKIYLRGIRMDPYRSVWSLGTFSKGSWA